MRSASLESNLPRSVPDMSFHEGCFRAFRAAWTALSTSSREAACTVAIVSSVLCVLFQLYILVCVVEGITHAGSTLAIVLGDEVWMNSLLTNIPNGC